MKIDDFDMTKAKNRKRIRADLRKCKIELSNFPRSSNWKEVIQACDLAHNGNELNPENVGYNILQTMRSIELLDEKNSPNYSIHNITQHDDLNIKKTELAMIVCRSEWMKEWIEWAGVNTVFDLRDYGAKKFLNEVSFGADNTLNLTSSKMNSWLRFVQEFHPSRDSSLSPDTKPWHELKRQEFATESIFEANKMIPAIQRVSKDAEFVRNGTGFLSIYGYDMVARNLSQAEMRLLVGSRDTRGRMEISDVVTDLRKSLETGAVSNYKNECAKKMRLEILGGGLRVRCLKARHTPDFHSKIQIYDRSAVLSGSMNLSYNGLVTNIENCEVVVDEGKIRYYIENFDNYFLEAVPIEDEILEMLDDTWALSSEELVNPRLVYLRILLEMYGDSSDQESSIGGISLDDYQEYSVNKSIRDLVDFGGSLLVSPTGTGKTLMGAIIARRMQQMKKISRVFVVAPNWQILDQWEDVFLKLRIPFTPIPLGEFREQTGDWKRKLESIRKSLSNDDLVIVDECHHIRNIGKNGSTNMMNTIGKPSKNSAHRLFLTATPISKELEELNNLLEFTHGYAKVRTPVDVSTAPTVTYLTHNLIAGKFAKISPTGHRFVEFSGEQRYFAIKITEKVPYESSDLDNLISLIKELPLRSMIILDSEQNTLDGTNGDSPGRSQELTRVHLSRVVESSPLAGLTFVNQKIDSDLNSKFFNSNSLENGLEKIKIILENMLVDDSKLKTCIENIRMEVENEDPVLIFCEFKDTVRYLREALGKEFGVVIETITGEDGKERRKKICKRFSPEYHGLRKRKTDPKILIATDALMEGVDLPDAKVVVNYDLFWTPLKLVQRVGRLDRPTKMKRSFRAINMIPSTEIYDSLFQLCTRLEDRSGMYRKMSGIEVFRNNTRDLDDVSPIEEGDEHDFEKFEDQYVTRVLEQLARATEDEKKNAKELRIGTTSNFESEREVGILSVVRDADGYTHLISEFYQDEWGLEKLDPENQESEIQLGCPKKEAEAVSIPNRFYSRHEGMLSRLSSKYNCDVEDLTPVVNLIRSK